jgi:hypothetical protein
MVLDSAISLENFTLFRNDRTPSIGGDVCSYINSAFYCKRLTEFESPSIESFSVAVRPKKLPRSISIILLAVICHSTSSGQAENAELYSHIQYERWCYTRLVSSITSAIANRQKALHESGKNSDIYRFWRNKVQSRIKVAREKYYIGLIEKWKIRTRQRWWNVIEKFLVPSTTLWWRTEFQWPGWII